MQMMIFKPQPLTAEQQAQLLDLFSLKAADLKLLESK